MHPGALVAIPLLILATGFFVAAEFAAVRVRSTQLEAIQDADPRAAFGSTTAFNVKVTPPRPARS